MDRSTFLPLQHTATLISSVDWGLEIKAAAMQNSTARGNPSDDLKSAAGEIYNKLRLLLDIHHPGGDKDAFMKDTLSPLIVPGMETYQELKADIVDKVTGV